MALFELREGACMHAENSVPQNSAAHQVTHIDAGALQLYTVGCFLSSPAVWGLVRVLPFLCCWSALEGRISILECAFWGFLLLFALLHLFPLLRLFVTRSILIYQGFTGQYHDMANPTSAMWVVALPAK